MPIEQVLTPDDVSAIAALTVPELWPPIDGRPAVDLYRQRPARLDLPDCDGEVREGIDGAQAWPRQFAVLLTEALTGERPARQILPYLSQRGSVHLHRLLPLFRDGQRARVQRVMTTQPMPDVIEMALIVVIGPRIRALAVRLTLAPPEQRAGWREKLPARVPASPAVAQPGWLCTDIEAA